MSPPFCGSRSRLEPLLLARLILVLLAVLVALIATAPGSAMALTRAERKATDVTRIAGASTATAAYLEIRFRGAFEDRLGRGGLQDARVAVKLVPATGAATVITVSGPSDAPEKRRRGTKGVSEIVRDGRSLLMLVKGLPAPIDEVVVTSLGRGKKDRLRTRIGALRTEAELEFGLELTDAAIAKLRDRLELANYNAYATAERIRALKQKLERARKPARIRRLRAKLAKQRAKLAKLNETRAGLAARDELLAAWLKVLEGALRDAATYECADGVDNGDPEDTAADFGVDLGCVMRLDIDEADVAMPLTCPPKGQAASVSGTITTSQSNVIERFIIYKLNPRPGFEVDPLEDAPVTATSGGPFHLPGDLCGQYIELSYSYRVYSDGTPFGAPDPPPGEYALTVSVTAQSRADSSNPGGQDAGVRLAAGTTR